MQGTESQDQVPLANVESISRQTTTEFPHEEVARTSKSVSLRSDGSEAVDRQSHPSDDDKRRRYGSEAPLSTATERNTPELDFDLPNRVSLAHIADVNERRYGLLAKVLSSDAAQRMEFQHRLDNFQYILGRLQSSVEALTSGVTGRKTGSAPKRSKARLKRLEGRLLADVEELTGHIQSTVLLMSRMRAGDRHVGEMTDALHNSLQAMSTALRRHKCSPDDDGIVHTSVSLVPTPSFRSVESNAARSPMVDELAKFCDAVANFKIMRERIDELYFERQEQEQRRDFLGDQELKLEKRNEKFLLTWHQSLANAEMEYQEAEAAVSHARKVCEDANVSIPLWAETDPALSEVYQDYDIPAQLASADFPEGVVPQRSSEPEASSSANSSEPVLIDASSLMLNPLNDQPSTGDKIAHWIEGVEPDVADPSSEFSLPPVPEDISSTIEYRFAQLRNPQP